MLSDGLRTLEFKQFPIYFARIRKHIYFTQTTGDDSFTRPLNYLFSAWLNQKFGTLILFGYHGKRYWDAGHNKDYCSSLTSGIKNCDAL